ncbi:MAG: dynamin family protein [Synergistaceae bacterium]|jgi:PAS domain-containing protein|nr:dynamin family protein [Synergistaceae bacterium]
MMNSVPKIPDDAGGVLENAPAEGDGFVWRQFLRHARECVLDVDFKARQIRCSAALLRSFRLTRETLPHTLDQWLELYHPDDYDKSLTFRRLVFGGCGENENETVFSLERRLYCGDGLYRWFRLDAFCLRGETGAPERLVGVETDLFPTESREERREEFREDRRTEPLPAARELEKKLAALETEKEQAEREKERLVTRLSQESLSREAAERRARLLARMLDASSEFLFHRDASGRLTFCNAAFADVMARDPGLAAWAGALSDVSGENSAEPEAAYRYEDTHGRTRLLSARLLPIAEAGRAGRGENSGGGVVGVLADVTGAAEAEADMARLRLLLGMRLVRRGFDTEPFDAETEYGPEQTEGFRMEDLEELRTEALPEVSGELGEDGLGKFERVFGGCLENALQKLAPVAGFFPTRVEQIEALLRAADEKTDLEVGVVGITSSGKSTFINAVMGERLLPEETRATTNLMIRCRRGAERFVSVVSKDGTRARVSGADLTAAWMESQSSERMNPANEKGVALLEWSSPGALLPEGLVLIDTPGLDADDFPEHSELVLRRLLPTLDIVLYITSIRNRLKAADIEALNAVLEQSQRLVFLLSQIDLEQDDTEGGRVVLSRRQKLSAYVRELREDIGEAGSASRERGAAADSAILPVSSKLALAHFYDRDSAEWRASNFGVLIERLEDFRAGLRRYRAGARAGRAAALLSRAARDLRLVLEERAGTGEDGPAGKTKEKIRQKIRELRDAQRWVNAEVSAVRNEWRRLLDPEYHLNCLEKEIESANTVKGVRDRYERWGAGCSDLTAQMTARLDRARRSCREILLKNSVVPGSRDWGAPETKEARSGLPVFHRYVFQKPQEIRVRGWFESLWFWPRHKTFFRQDVDKALMMEGARELLSERLRFLNGHLAWWENKMREDCCEPLFEELAREEAAMADAGRAAAEESASRSALLQALDAAQEAEAAIRNALADLFSDLFALTPEDPGAPAEELFGELGEAGREPAKKEEAQEEAQEEAGLFTPLLATFREQDIQSRFLRLDALRSSRRVVLLGLRRHDSLRLLSLLAHDIAFSDSLRGSGDDIDERKWLFCGSTPPALPHVRIAAPDTLLRELEILAAPGDALCAEEFLRREGSPPVDWNDLFAEWLPVVHLDIARVDSGLSDLARAPYIRALPHARRWVAASGQGALFNARLSDLLTDVPDRADLFAWRRGFRERAEWFVYENYDARYTDFMLWGREEALPPNGRSGGAFTQSEAFMQKWAESGNGFAFPFSEFRMRLALSKAKHRQQGPGAPAPHNGSEGGDAARLFKRETPHPDQREGAFSRLHQTHNGSRVHDPGEGEVDE